MSAERPTTGGTIWLDDLAPLAGGAIVYRALLLLPDAEHAGTATVDAAGNVTFSPWTPPDPPSWLVDYTRQFLRGEWRARRGDDPPPWPRRITRWRAPS